MEFVFPVTVEFEDVDSFKIVYHPKLITYLDRARIHFISSLGNDISYDEVVPVVYDLKVRFRKPAKLLDRLVVTVQINEFDGFRLLLGYKIKRDSDTIVQAKSTIAFYDLRARQIVEAPEWYQSSLQSYLTGIDGEQRVSSNHPVASNKGIA